MTKKTFLHTPSALITNEYVAFNSSWKIDIKRVCAVFITKQADNRHHCILIGLFILIIGAISESTAILIIGLLCIIGAILMKATYMLRLKMDTGEIRPLKSKNKNELEEIKSAIERAMFYNDEEEKEQLMVEH